MKKLLVIPMLLMLIISSYGCSSENEVENKMLTFAGFKISINSDETLCFYGLEKMWENIEPLYIPSKICGRNVTRLSYDNEATWEGCIEIYIPSSVVYIENRTFTNYSNSLSDIYWDRGSVYSTSFVPSYVRLHLKDDYGDYVVYSR